MVCIYLAFSCWVDCTCWWGAVLMLLLLLLLSSRSLTYFILSSYFSASNAGFIFLSYKISSSRFNSFSVKLSFSALNSYISSQPRSWTGKKSELEDFNTPPPIKASLKKSNQKALRWRKCDELLAEARSKGHKTEVQMHGSWRQLNNLVREVAHTGLISFATITLIFCDCSFIVRSAWSFSLKQSSSFYYVFSAKSFNYCSSWIRLRWN